MSSLPRTLVTAAMASCLVAGAGEARAQAWRDQGEGMPNTPAVELSGVGLVEHLGDALPRDAAFRDTEGKPVKLGEYFDGKSAHAAASSRTTRARCSAAWCSTRPYAR